MEKKVARRTLVLLALGILTGCGGDDPSPANAAAGSPAEAVSLDPALVQAAPPGTPEAVLREGRELYVVCSVCHGNEAHGTQLGPSLRDTTWIHVSADIDQIAALIRSGVETPREFEIPMPVMGGGSFDDGQLRALATYVYALGRTGS